MRRIVTIGMLALAGVVLGLGHWSPSTHSHGAGQRPDRMADSVAGRGPFAWVFTMARADDDHRGFPPDGPPRSESDEHGPPRWFLGRHVEDHDQAREALQAGEIKPLREVLAIVESQFTGQMLEAELERKRGKWVYEIKTLAPDGSMMKLYYDANTLELLKARGHGLEQWYCGDPDKKPEALSEARGGHRGHHGDREDDHHGDDHHGDDDDRHDRDDDDDRDEDHQRRGGGFWRFWE